MKKILLTGSAGFIGFHLAKLLLEKGFNVLGYDGFTDYYDVKLKQARNNILTDYKNFTSINGMLEDVEKINEIANQFRPEIIIHLAAQAGVRYSLENPRSYINTNIIGTFNVMEIAKSCQVEHFLMASTSSVYGSNIKLPFVENEKADTPLTIYAASKKSNEVMAHSYSYLWKIPTTIFRFFTVYGPWGRPDMALFKFVKSILNERPIDIYNKGEMFRDFTYVDDLVEAIRLLVDKAPNSAQVSIEKDNLSNVAPFRIINIGNSSKVKLINFIEEIEKNLGKKAIKNFLPMQKGDVMATWSDISLLTNLTNYTPQVDYKEGVKRFIEWYLGHYK